jgi:uncharacterized protein
MKAVSNKPVVVFDTNVLVSMLGFRGRLMDALLALVDAGMVQPCISEFIIGELVRNLAGKAKMSEEDIHTSVGYLRARFRLFESSERVTKVVNCEADNRILECALAADAEFLVTGNFKHLRPIGDYCGIRIVTPREFMDIFTA